MTIRLLTAALLLGTAGFAHAADAVVEEVAVDIPTGFNWTGGYIGVHLGGGWSDVDFVYQDGGNRADHSGDGAIGGAQIGYNFQSGNFVFGAEADISAAGVDGSTSCPNDSWSCESSIDLVGSVRGRIGYSFDRFLVYGTGGLGFADVEIQTVDSSGDVFGSSETMVGWTVGAGAEYAFTDNWTLKAEYKYFDLGSDSFEVDNDDIVDADVNLQTAVIGLNYKF